MKVALMYGKTRVRMIRELKKASKHSIGIAETEIEFLHLILNIPTVRKNVDICCLKVIHKVMIEEE